MGIVYEKQIANGVYPSKNVFEQYYIVDNHSISETALYFNVTTTIVKNLIKYFNLHKDKQNSITTCARKRIENNNYPSKEELLEVYFKCDKSWAKTANYYGYARITLSRIRKRYNLIKKPNSVLSEKESFLKYIKDNNIKSINELSKSLDIKINQIYYWAEKHNIIEQISKISSYPEEEIKMLLSDYLFIKDRTVLKPFEIDLFNKDKKIGIEYNGIFWHSLINKEKKYHFNKSLKADEQKIYLIHIYEDEWIKKDRKGIEKFLKHVFSNSIIESCDNFYIKEVNKKEEKEFNQYNHYDGHKDSDLCLGLYNNDTLLQLISFKKINNDYIIIRDYPEINNLYYNGYEKIFNYFLNNYYYEKIEVKCDFDKNNGSIYEKLGFDFLKYTGPKKRIINPSFKNNYTVYDSAEKIYMLKKEGDFCD